MNTVQPEYLVRTKTVKEFPAPPAGDEWHNPEGLPAERVPEGMRLITERERAYFKSKYEIQKDLYSFFTYGRLTDGFLGDSQAVTYFTSRSYPVWERPQFYGNKFDANKFYGTCNKINEKGLIIDTGLRLERYRVHCFREAFTTGNYYWKSGSLREIREIFNIYEFDSLLELAKWAEEN